MAQNDFGDHGEAAFHAATRPAYDHIRPAPPLAQHPNARRGQSGSMPLGQTTKRLSGAFAGIPQSSDTLAGEAASGGGQGAAAAGGYSSVGGGTAAGATAGAYAGTAATAGPAAVGDATTAYGAPLPGSPPANPAGSPWAPTSTGGTAARVTDPNAYVAPSLAHASGLTGSVAV